MVFELGFEAGKAVKILLRDKQGKGISHSRSVSRR